jgi:hypothetical protein
MGEKSKTANRKKGIFLIGESNGSTNLDKNL